MRTCSKCLVLLEDDRFYKTKGQCKGCILQKDRWRVCKGCCETKSHKHFERHSRTCLACCGRDVEADPVAFSSPISSSRSSEEERVPEDIPMQWLRKLVRDSRGRAFRLDERRFQDPDYEYDVDLDHCIALWRRQEGLCALTGQPMSGSLERVRSVRLENASLDRVDSRSNYSKANTQLVCVAANMMKSTFSTDEYLRFSRLAVLHADRVIVCGETA